jgi:Carboxypeptidase regulatory-like domain
MRGIVRVLVVVFSALVIPHTALAQAVIAGSVEDTSGAVLPGVTVEAASPVLIEKVRSAVSDGNGVYRIEDLRPGTYTVTFTLPGFATLKREGIVLTGTFTAGVDAEMKVGGLDNNTYAPPTATAPSVFQQPLTVATPLMVRFTAEFSF